MVSVTSSAIESIPAHQNQAGFFLIEAFTTGVFTLEIIGRYIGVANHIAYLFDPLNLLDILATVPFFIQIGVPNLPAVGGVLRMFRLTRLARLRAIQNRYTPMIVNTFLNFVSTVLPSVVVIYIVALLAFGSIIVMFEKNAPSHYYDGDRAIIDSLPQGMWWALVTMTTVGYGDYFPITPWGKMISLVVVILGVIITALIIFVVGEMFHREYKAQEAQLTETAKLLVAGGVIRTVYDPIPDHFTDEDLFIVFDDQMSNPENRAKTAFLQSLYNCRSSTLIYDEDLEEANDAPYN